MSEEQKPGEGTPGEGEQIQEKQTELTAVEQEALAQGWVPKEEFEGDSSKWVDAGEFVRRGELFKKIENQRKETSALRQAFNDLKNHYTKVKQIEYDRALSDLKKQYKLANREGDFDKADEIEAEIEQVEKEAKTVIESTQKIAQEAAAIHPEFKAWVDKNDWYITQPHMKTYADTVGLRLHEAGTPKEEVLKKVEEAVRKEFPNKFENPNRQRPSPVEGANNRGVTRAAKEYQLSDQEERVFKTLSSQRGKDGKPFITREQYVAELKAIKKEK